MNCEFGIKLFMFTLWTLQMYACYDMHYITFIQVTRKMHIYLKELFMLKTCVLINELINFYIMD